MHAAKTRARDQRAGRERPHELFGRLKAEKVGSLPPVLVFFLTRLFFSLNRYLSLMEKIAHATA
jgi:hypothetical protein